MTGMFSFNFRASVAKNTVLACRINNELEYFCLLVDGTDFLRSKNYRQRQHTGCDTSASSQPLEIISTTLGGTR